MNAIELTKKLVEIPSESGKELAIGKYLENRLKKNFDVKIQKVNDSFNILATYGNPKLLLTTHMDTVPGQLEIYEDSKYLYGRGSCDAKASLASMIIAGENAKKKRMKDFALLFDVDEETNFTGIYKAVNLINPRYTVVGEPTNFNPIIGQKGLLGFKIKCYGKSAHGSRPWQGESAINKLVDTINSMDAIDFPDDDYLGKTTTNVGFIKGGDAPNKVSKYAEAFVEIRTTKSNEEIKSLLSKLETDKIKLKYDYSFESALAKDEEYLSIFPGKRETIPAFTEMYFWAQKCPAVVFGPGENEYSHTEKERIAKDDLQRAVIEYESIIKKIYRRRRKC
ncbi:M20/M25/M40 family metallo-hydrolase [Candidatus Woesearchaeota archaeon]|nr:M20/M25/M40 family metallo-hydrolase [Candidatus Woesearchaeota archaeon]